MAEKELKIECKNCLFYPAGGYQCVMCNQEEGYSKFISKPKAALPKGDTNESN